MTTGAVPPVGEVGEVPALAVEVFETRLPAAQRYVELLTQDATVRGLIGPREVPRLWQRHVLNCAVVEQLIDPGARVLDIGSGAGLPGVPLALARPDLTVILVEPLLRRVTFLADAVQALGLDSQVTVVRARAREVAERADVVTSRALAPVVTMAEWCLPLVRQGGQVLAIRGQQAEDEVIEQGARLDQVGAGPRSVHRLSRTGLEVPTTVVQFEGSRHDRST